MRGRLHRSDGMTPTLLALALAAALAAQSDSDRDRDGLSDFHEVHKYSTDPAQADSDGDGTPDGDWAERREFTYTVRSIVHVLPPVTPDVTCDDYQDARILEATGDYVELEVIHYPLNTVAEAIEADPQWRSQVKRMKEYLAPGPTANWDAEMRRDLVAALEKDGIDVEELDDKALVEEASRWLLRHAAYVDGFSTFCSWFPDRDGEHFGEAAVYPGMEEAAESGKAEKGLTLDEQWQRELFAKGMFENGVRGSCTSSAIYMNGCLRALGVPTRIVLCIPLVDASDEREIAFLRERLTHHEVRRTVVRAIQPGTGWTSHTFNEVFVGGRWRRLNYDRLGQNILDERYLGLMTHVATFADWADGVMPRTWGLRQAGLRAGLDVFGGSNPYSTITLSDLFGEHCTIENPAPEGELFEMAIDSLTWSDDGSVPESIRESFEGPPALLGHVVEWQGFEALKRFTEDADARFYLEADGHPTLGIGVNTGGITSTDGELRWVVLPLGGADWRDFVPGVEYTLRARNAKEGYRWVVAPGLVVRRVGK